MTNRPQSAHPVPLVAGEAAPELERLRKHADYQRAYAAACKRQSSNMAWFVAARPLEGGVVPPGRVGLTVGKVIGKAHERNRIKRRMREALRKHADRIPAGVDLILHPRRAVLTVEFAKLEGEVARILRQARGELARSAPRPLLSTPGEPS